MRELHRTATAFLVSECINTLNPFTQDVGHDVLLLFHPKYNKWMAPGGHIENGEMAHETVQREIKEETGLDLYFETINFNKRSLILPRPFIVVQYHYDDVPRTDEDFLYAIKVSQEIRNRPLVTEGPPVQWFHIDEAIATLDMYADTKQHLRSLPFHLAQQERLRNNYLIGVNQ